MNDAFRRELRIARAVSVRGPSSGRERRVVRPVVEALVPSRGILILARQKQGVAAVASLGASRCKEPSERPRGNLVFPRSQIGRSPREVTPPSLCVI